MTKYIQKYQDKDHLMFIQDFKPVIQELHGGTYKMILSDVVTIHANGFVELIDNGIEYAQQNGFGGYKYVRTLTYLPNEERVEINKFKFSEIAQINIFFTIVSILLVFIVVFLYFVL